MQHMSDFLPAQHPEWEAKIAAEAENLKRHQAILGHLLDTETTRALREKFRLLARRLHPDLNPEQSRAVAELWHRVTAAYEAQDLEELEAIEILSRGADYVQPPPSLDALNSLLEKLRKQLDRLLIALADRRAVWPFDQLPVLDSEEATTARQTDLDIRIAGAEAMRDERKLWLNQLLDH